MSLTLRILCILGSAITFLVIASRVRKARVRIDDSVFWIVFSFALLVIAIVMPESAKMTLAGNEVPVKVLLIILCGLCTSVMWGVIFNLATEGLGKYTPSASGLFMTMVVGGGIMPLIQNLMAGKIGDINSYWLVVAMLAYLLFYAVIGCKPSKKA